MQPYAHAYVPTICMYAHAHAHKPPPCPHTSSCHGYHLNIMPATYPSHECPPYPPFCTCGPYLSTFVFFSFFFLFAFLLSHMFLMEEHLCYLVLSPWNFFHMNSDEWRRAARQCVTMTLPPLRFCCIVAWSHAIPRCSSPLHLLPPPPSF